MKRTVAMLLAMLMVLALVLSGCNQAEKQTLKAIEEERKALETDFATVMAEYDGGQVTKFDIMPIFYNQYAYMYQFYSMFGMEVDSESINAMIMDSTKFTVQSAAIAKQFAERGLTMSVTEEELKAEVQASYDDSMNYYLDMIESDSEKIKKANAELAMYSEGFTFDSLYNYERSFYQSEAVKADVYSEIADVTDEEVQTAYDAKLAEDEEQYTLYPSGIESIASTEGSLITWYPEGYRTVKHILVIPEETLLTAVADARTELRKVESELTVLNLELEDATTPDEEETVAETEEAVEETAPVEEPAEVEEITAETEEVAEETAVVEETAEAEETVEAEPTEAPRALEEIQADIDAKTVEVAEAEAAVQTAVDACLESVKDKVDEIYAKLDAGEEFDSVMAEYGEDPGMKSEPNMTNGYYVSAGSTSWDSMFTAGAMELTSVGEYSAEPVVSGSGVHIISYNADVTPGAVALEDISEEMYALALENKRSEYYNEQLLAWVEALNPVYHEDAWVVG